MAQSISALFEAPGQAIWCVAVGNIMTAALGPPLCQIADFWGRKLPLVIGGICGVTGAIVVSRAQNMATVIAGFSILGVSYGSQPLTFAIVSEILPRKHRPLAQGTLNVTSSLGAISGTCIGGALLRRGNLENYRIYLYILAGIYFGSTITLVLFYTPPPRQEEKTQTGRQKLSTLDWIGYILFAPGLCLFCMALAWSHQPYSWDNVHILATFIIGIALLFFFCLYEWLWKKDGIMHHGLFARRDFAISLINVAVEGFTFFAINYYYAFEVSVFIGADLFISGLHYGVMFAVALVATAASSAYSTRLKALRSPTIVGFVINLIFSICMATSTPRTKHGAFWGFPALFGAAVGLVLPTIMVSAQLATDAELISITSGLIIGVRSLGGVIGLAIMNAVSQEAWIENIPHKVAAAVLPLGFPASSLEPLLGALTTNNQKALLSIPGVTPEMVGVAISALREGYSIGFRNVWITTSCFTTIAIAGKTSSLY